MTKKRTNNKDKEVDKYGAWLVLRIAAGRRLPRFPLQRGSTHGKDSDQLRPHLGPSPPPTIAHHRPVTTNFPIKRSFDQHT